MRAFRPAGVLAAIAAVWVAAHAPAAWAPEVVRAGARAVSVGDNYFRPSRVRVRRGGAVTWTWTGRARHNVYFVGGPRRIRTCRARRHGRCTRRFTRRGAYRYVCTFHGSMVGRVAVIRH
jgi:plastocyanin